MKTLLKLTIAGAAFVASNAFADVIPATSGNGELMLFVRDVGNPTRVYARGLGIQINSVLSEATTSGAFTGPVQNFSYALPGDIGPDGNLTGFLTGGSSGTSYVWTVMAGDTDTDTTVGTQRFLTTTPNNVTSGPENGVIGGLWTNLDAMVTGVNNILPGAPGSGDSTSSNGLWGQSGTNFANAGSWFGAGFNNINALGTAANLYVIANSSDESLDISRAYKAVFGLQLLADGTLKSVGSQVPLPAGIWLLGSALAGLAGIGRRRALQTAAAA